MNENNKPKTMTVPEMRKLLGLKKTESYWLVHRNFFRTDVIDGHMRIDVESFEAWYANQVKHKKVTGEEPGTELAQTSYSFREAANMLGVHSSTLYEIWRQEDRKFITVDFVKRIPKEEFDSWYENQIMFQKVAKLPTITDLEANYISLADAAMLLGITKEKLSYITRSSKFTKVFEIVVFDDKKWISKSSFQLFLNAQSIYKVIYKEAADNLDAIKVIETKEYIAKADAALLAGVTAPTITKWAQDGKFKVIGAGRVMRIHREEFLDWLRDSRGKEY